MPIAGCAPLFSSTSASRPQGTTSTYPLPRQYRPPCRRRHRLRRTRRAPAGRHATSPASHASSATCHAPSRRDRALGGATCVPCTARSSLCPLTRRGCAFYTTTVRVASTHALRLCTVPAFSSCSARAFSSHSAHTPTPHRRMVSHRPSHPAHTHSTRIQHHSHHSGQWTRYHCAESAQ
jgi:hypothetical protein